MATDETYNEEDDVITREYECGYLLLPTIPSEKVEQYEEQIKKTIQDNGGEIANHQTPQRMPLAYTMHVAREGKRDSYTEAYFGWVTFEATTEAVNEIKEALRGDESLIRYMVVRASKDQEPVSPEGEESEEEAPAADDGADEAASPEAASEDIDKSIDNLVADEAEKKEEETATSS